MRTFGRNSMMSLTRFGGLSHEKTHVIGTVCGYQPCCLRAYRQSALSKPRTKKEKKNKRKQKVLRKVQDTCGVVSIYRITIFVLHQFWPCAACAYIALRRWNKTKDILFAFETVIQRPWPLTVDWEHQWDKADNMTTSGSMYDIFNDHAFEILSVKDYKFIMDYLYPQDRVKQVGPHPVTVTVKIGETDSMKYRWQTTYDGFRRKVYSKLPEFCIPCN